MREIIDVTGLNRYAKAIITESGRMNDLIVCGEITNFVRHYKSKHCYFTLRDDKSSVKCVMFSRNAALIDFMPEDGMMVLAYGSATIYERDGIFQFYVDFMRPFGVGAAQKAFDQLKEKLEKEGLFAAEHKKKLPSYPACIGVVTSATGAAIQDIKNVISRRWPQALLLLASVNVQGLDAVDQISAGIRALDQDKRTDVIIIARGGGSREDLWVFNSEKIARTAFACKTPLVSAVGHEIDYTILDYVADLRAPTPSAAAELCAPDREECIRNIKIIRQNIQNAMQHKSSLCYNKLKWVQMEQYKSLLVHRISADMQSVHTIKLRYREQMQTKYGQNEARLAAVASRADSLSPYRVLARGYTIAQKNGHSVRVRHLSAGDEIQLIGENACAQCLVHKVVQKEK